MNKQELISRLKEILTTPSEIEGYDFDYGHDYGIKRSIALAEQLDEQGKLIVPKYVADWYEENKDYFEWNLYNLCVDFHQRELPDDLYEWFNGTSNKPIETLVRMKLFGYEVEKGKLYRAKNRHTGEYLCYCFEFFHDKNSSSENQRFTAEEKHWRELGYWGNDLYVFEEVEGEDE